MSARAGQRVAFSCPACRMPGALAPARRLVLPGDRRTDEIVLEILACRCGFKCLAVTEQLQTPQLAGPRRGSDDPRMAFRLSEAAVDLLAFLIAQCPDPAEEYCACPAHAALNRRDLRDRWNVLHSFAPLGGLVLEAPLPRATAPAPEIAYASLIWNRDGAACVAEIEGRLWRVDSPSAPGKPPFELSVDGGMEFEFGVWPPFWHTR